MRLRELLRHPAVPAAAASLAVLLASTSAKAATPATSAACAAPTRVPVVSVTVVNAPVSIDTTRNAAQLAALSGATRHGGPVVRGVTRTSFSADYSVGLVGQNVPGGHCMAVSRVEIKVGYDPMTVYIQSKYPAGSCEYRVVMEHEQEHVRINHATLNAHIPAVKAAAERAVATFFPLFATSVENARALAMRQISGAVNAALADLDRERTALHGKLDSPASYRASQNRCANW